MGPESTQKGIGKYNFSQMESDAVVESIYQSLAIFASFFSVLLILIFFSFIQRCLATLGSKHTGGYQLLEPISIFALKLDPV